MEDSLLGPSARPSDEDAAVSATGSGDVEAAVFSMTRRTADGSDAAYLRWHMLDHLTEQYRIVGFRHGQRWVSTPECRAARAVSAGSFDDVDHIVNYLFAEPLEAAFDDFSALGATLLAADRMPASSFGAAGSDMNQVRRVHIGVYDVVATAASRAALVGAAVIPWRPARGVYVLVERVAAGAEGGAELDRLAQTPGVAGLWRYRGSKRPFAERYGDHADLTISVFYLDEDPVKVAGELGSGLAARWAGQQIEPLLAAPFEIVVPWQWDRALP